MTTPYYGFTITRYDDNSVYIRVQNEKDEIFRATIGRKNDDHLEILTLYIDQPDLGFTLLRVAEALLKNG